MSIDERISDALFDYCIAWRDRASAVQDKVEAELRDAIKQRVAEAVKAEREAIASIGDERAKALLSIIGLAVVPSAVIQRDRAEQWRLYAAAIRARANNGPNRLPSHRCSSLCSPDETFCAITKDGKCDAMDRSCDAALAATEPKP